MHPDTLAQMDAVTTALYLSLPCRYDPSPETQTLTRLFCRFGYTSIHIPHPSTVQAENKRDAWWYDERNGTYLTRPAA